MKGSFSDIIGTEQPVLVDFSADWCGPCKMMAPILSDVKKQLGEGVRIIKIDVDQNPHLAQAYHVQGVPTLILFRKGQVLWRQSGVVPAHTLAGVIKPHIPAS